ncbi:hypothetical protein [Staphylococcus haemolyticus]|uniref:hypothetical protein n=1 Tax=Staphylococcus haemolyticus TaxID=1283 RepID=UPI003D99473C
MNNKVKLARRHMLDLMFEECLDIINNAPARSTMLFLSLDERQIFNELINEMVSIVSTIEKNVSGYSFTKEYISISYDVIYRMFFKTEVTTCRATTLLKFIDECREIADRELGTLEELKKNNDVKDALVVQ